MTSVSDRHLRATPRLLVSRSGLIHNRDAIRSLLHADGLLCGVVKADAYGHGAAQVATVLTTPTTPTTPTTTPTATPAVRSGVDALAVATLDEALALPDLGVPVLVLRPMECCYVGDTLGQVARAIERGVVMSVISAAGAGDVARVAASVGIRAEVQVMLDTGMTREMCDATGFEATMRAVRARPELRLAGVGTHFTDGEAWDEPFNDEQCRAFHDALDGLGDLLPRGVVRHACNSGGLFSGAQDDFEMVRPGLAVYGIHPSCRSDVALVAKPRLRPVARWLAPLLTIRDVSAGRTVGYNRTWQARRDTRIGLVPVGYADGYRRCLGGRSLVRVPDPHDPTGGLDAFCPVVGRVSMDYLTIDLHTAPWAMPGDEVRLLDDDPASPCSVYTLAEQAQTIPYELFCGIGPRIRRVLTDSDAVN
jgi:alanine racemase